MILNPTRLGRLWTPEDDGCPLWLEAFDYSSITFDGSGFVSQWNDKSGNGFNATMSTASRRPGYSATGINGYPSLVFDGTDDGMVCSVPAGTFPSELFFVSAVKKTGSPNTYESRPAARSISYYPAPLIAYNERILWGDGSQSPNFASSPVDMRYQTSDTILTWGLSSGNCYDRKNGSPVLTVAATVYGDNSAEIWIGTRVDGAPKLRGNISVVIACTQSSIEKCEGYIAHQFGLAGNLPVSHPYKYNPPIV